MYIVLLHFIGLFANSDVLDMIVLIPASQNQHLMLTLCDLQMFILLFEYITARFLFLENSVGYLM